MALELVSLSVHRAYVRATQLIVTLTIDSASFCTRVALVHAHGDSNRGRLTASAQLEAGVRARCGPGVIQCSSYDVVL